MNTNVRSLAVASCGLITSVITATVTMYLSRAINIDIFSFSLWVVIPAGAIGVGFVAALGYYFASLWLHHRPTLPLLLQMVVIAGFTQWLIYYLGYRTFDFGGGRYASDVLTFGQYLNTVLTKEHMRFGRIMADVGEVGTFGYWLAGIQFVGFLLGGLSLWCILRARPFCRDCSTYLRKLASRTKTFADSTHASYYYDQVFTNPVDAPEFAAFIRVPAMIDKPQQGAIKVVTALYGCPKCADQLIEDKVEAFNGKEWKEVPKLNRRISIPQGVNLQSAFAP